MKEGSKAEQARDKRQAKARGMTVKKWEGSAADKRSDAVKGAKKGRK